MRVYNCQVNVGKEHLTTVQKNGVTAAEIIVLRAIHGGDAVLDIRKGRMDKRAHAEEYARLEAIYGGTKVKLGDEDTSPSVPVLIALFGPAGGSRLPVELDGDADLPFVDGKVEKIDREGAPQKSGAPEAVAA